MRYGILVTLGLGACIGLHQVLSAQTTASALSDEARIAIDLRCADRADRTVRDCRRLLERLYLAGSLEPERTLRAHCTRGTVAWRARRSGPPALCVERYGGWQG